MPGAVVEPPVLEPELAPLELPPPKTLGDVVATAMLDVLAEAAQWPDDAPRCACGIPAGYQVRADWITRQWSVVAVTDTPRYCKHCAEQRQMFYHRTLR
jgi:hypothetical protein